MRLGIAGVAHVHAPSYPACLASCQGVRYQGYWDPNPQASESFGTGEPAFATLESLLEVCDAVIIAGTNQQHLPTALAALSAKKHVLCEKPLAPTVADAEAICVAANRANCVLMTAFPCPYSPAFQKALLRVRNGEIGELRAVCATNRGSFPGGWFVDLEHSGGGALLDHTVHVADLLRRLIGSEPTEVFSAVGNELKQSAVEDTAMLTLKYPGGLFATLDASWSRSPGYKTWGDVMLNIVGTTGVIELDLFGPGLDVYGGPNKSHRVDATGANLDLLMVQEFLSAIREGREPLTSGRDGLEAVRVAEMAYANKVMAGSA